MVSGSMETVDPGALTFRWLMSPSPVTSVARSRFSSRMEARLSMMTEASSAFSSMVTTSATPWAIWRVDPGVRSMTFLRLPASWNRESSTPSSRTVLRPRPSSVRSSM